MLGSVIHPRQARRAVLLLGALLHSAAGMAAESAGGMSSFALRGFGTLGIARSSSAQAEFVRDLSQPSGTAGNWTGKIDSLAGLQANLRASEKFEAVAQVVSRYHSPGNYRPELIWAFLKFEPNSHVSLRGGRLGTEFYMLADSRLVAYSYLTVRPPNDYYGALPFTYIDGVDALATLPLGDGLLRGKLFAGVMREQAPLAEFQWDLNQSPLSGGHFDYQNGHWQWRLGYAQVRFRHDLPGPAEDLRNALGASGAPGAAAAAREISVVDKLSRFHSAGVVYDNGPLRAQLMLSETRQASAIFQDSRSAYLVAGYRFGELTPYAGYSRVRSTAKRLVTGSALDPLIARALADSHSDQHTATLGARWDFRRNLALKAQLDGVRGTAQSIFPYRWEQAGWNGKTDVFSLALDFVF